MLTNSLSQRSASYGVPSPRARAQTATLLSLDQRRSDFETQLGHAAKSVVRPLGDSVVSGAFGPRVETAPSHAVERRAVAWHGMAAEIVQAPRPDRVEFRFRARHHLLVVHTQGVRRAGETFVGGLPGSTLRDFSRKLTFVPAGHDYIEWLEPRGQVSVTYFYFDPASMPAHPSGATDLVPRLFFEDAVLLDTALKLTALIESADGCNRLYLEALGAVLAHELVRLNNAELQRVEAPARGGLAPWQQRIVTDFIEAHLAEHISLDTLAQLVGLSRYYFCRAFKQSLGIPPHRYHNNQRIEQAKALLAKHEFSVTDIGFQVGFSDTSSFSAAFRKTTGLTPTAYHRSLA
jgi:AraC family transcriptional regulator